MTLKTSPSIQIKNSDRSLRKTLERNLSLKMVIAISIGAMLGSGIFVLPGLAAVKTGTSVWLAYVLAGICVLPAALSKAELATAMPTSGGTYVYLERAFGPLVGTISGLGLWTSLVLKSSFALVGFGAYLDIIADIPVAIAALTLLCLITLVNLFGAVKVGQVQMVIVILTLATLLCVSFIAYPLATNPHNNPVLINGWTGLFSATAYVFVAFAGVTKIAAISEEVEDPQKNIPKGMLFSLILITGLYALVVYLLVNILSITELAHDLHPISSLGGVIFGKAGSITGALLGILTMSSMANSGILASSRFPFAMSRDNLLPEIFRTVHPRFRTPAFCILLTSAVMALAILMLDIEKIVKLASAFMIVSFIGVNISLIVLRQTGVQWYKPEYQSPFYPWIQLFGVISGSLLLYELGTTVIWAIILVSVLGMILFFAYGNPQTNRRGVLSLYRRRASLLFFSGMQTDAKYSRSLKAGHLPASSMKIPKIASTSRSSVVIPLLGDEHSPEMLVEIASALSADDKIDAVYLSEVPEQAVLEPTLEEELILKSMERRLSAMSLAENTAVVFEAIFTHDRLNTLRSINDDKNVRWLVMQWDGNAGAGIFFDKPVGWLISHLSCNLALIKDAGIRHIRAILVYFKPGPDQQLVMDTVNRLAKQYQAQVTFVRVIPKDASETEYQSQKDLLESYASDCLMACNSIIIKSDDKIRSIATLSAGYDLLVTESPNRLKFGKFILGIKKDLLTQKAACSVLRLRTPRFSPVD